VGSSTFPVGNEACATAPDAADDVVGCEGGGLVSRLLVMDVGSASRARRKPVLMKSRCFWEAVKFVRISACSSDPCVALRA